MASCIRITDKQGKQIVLGARAYYDWPGRRRLAIVTMLHPGLNEVQLEHSDTWGNPVIVFASPGEVELVLG